MQPEYQNATIVLSILKMFATIQLCTTGLLAVTLHYLLLLVIEDIQFNTI
jgi:hypothetical protein